MESMGGWTGSIQVLSSDDRRATRLTGRSLFVPSSPFVLELTKGGDKANGTPVVITLAKPDVEAHEWRFVEVSSA